MLLDEGLSENTNYAFYRSSGLLGQARVEVLAPGTFAARRAAARQGCDAVLPQQKHRVVIDLSELERLRLTSDDIRTEGRPLAEPSTRHAC